jgi:tetratricopeptide (TPR) repeat protein
MKISPLLALTALVAIAFTLASGLVTQADGWSRSTKSDNIFGMMFGDGRKLFANQFFTEADVYFHSGYYPSIFDRSGRDSEITETSHGHTDSPDDEIKEDFFGRTKDWVDAFGRNFRVTKHTHLESGNEREILPWLRLAADLDPQKTETYTVGAFFLWDHLHKSGEAEAFLREGLRNNPDNCEILFALGRLYNESTHDTVRARNVWELGVKKFLLLPPDEQKENKIVFDELSVNLARLEDQAGNYGAAINWFHAAQKVSPDPGALQQQIDVIQKKLDALIHVAPQKLY